MKKRLAILLLSVLVLTCAFTALSASAASYKDVVNLLPANEDIIQQNSAEQNGIVDFSLSNGKLTLTRDPDSQIFWPSIRYEVLEEVDLSVTPYLHLSFTCSAEGEDPGRGVNGHVFYTVNGGEEQDGWFSEIAGRGDEDFRGSADVYFDFTKVANTTGKITITQVVLSIYGNPGETVVWNAIAMAGEDGAEAPEESDPESTEPVESTPAEETSAAESAEETSSEESSLDDATVGETTSSTSSDSSASTAVTSETSSTASSDDSSDSNTWVIILVVVCVVVVAVVVAVVIVKKKKK